MIISMIRKGYFKTKRNLSLILLEAKQLGIQTSLSDVRRAIDESFNGSFYGNQELFGKATFR